MNDDEKRSRKPTIWDSMWIDDPWLYPIPFIILFVIVAIVTILWIFP